MAAARNVAQIVLAVLAILAVGPQAEARQIAAHGYVGYATATEIVLLPKFCMAQFTKEFGGPEYEIDDNYCGPGTNHYCLGLVDIIRANRATKIAQKREHLRMAGINTEYTANAIAGMQSCPIREHVEKTQQQIRSLQAPLKGLK